uniref:Ig-like domain-containing protein n=1 Tax=Athene cunicularia TaxID=194338 RepID=A0A663MAV3_ATHCN
MVVSLDVLPLALLEQAAGLTTEENEDVKIDFQVTEMPPRFAVPFADVKVTEGLEAVFECVVTGTPVPVVQWFRGNTCVTPATGKYVVSQKEGLHSLKVQNVSPLDGGSYQCRAINRLGEAMCKGSLVVLAQQGASAKASSCGQCTTQAVETVAASVPHKPQKCDLLLSKTVSPGDQSEIELEFEFKPRIDDSQKAIQLRAVTQKEQEVEGENCSFEFQVTEAPPKFLRLISDYSTFVGASACFHCLVTGSPHPSIHWYKDGVLLEGDRYCVQEEQGGSHSLTIEDLMQSDSGQYKCIATNRAGTITCSAHLHVRQRIPGVPYFAREPDSVRCAPGFTAVFEYTVAGEPCPDVQWFKGTEQLFSDARRSVAHHPDGTGSLTVWECMEEDTGLYMCRAVSTLGEATCSAELLVLPEEHAVCRQNPVLQHSAQNSQLLKEVGLWGENSAFLLHCSTNEIALLCGCNSGYRYSINAITPLITGPHFFLDLWAPFTTLQSLSLPSPHSLVKNLVASC